MEKELRRFAVWSNVFYAVPLLGALYFNLSVVPQLMSALIISSSAFHLSRERRLFCPDIVVAYIVLVQNIVLMYLSGYEPMLFSVIGATLAVALYIRYFREHGDRGGLYHGWWHVLAATITFFCILGYAQ